VAILEVFQVILGDQIDVVLLGVVPRGVLNLSWAVRGPKLLPLLMFEFIFDIGVFAQVFRKSYRLLDVDSEVQLFTKELLGFFDQQVFWEVIMV